MDKQKAMITVHINGV